MDTARSWMESRIIYDTPTNPATAQDIEDNINTFYRHLLMNGYIIVLPEGTLTSEHGQSNNARTVQHHRAVGHYRNRIKRIGTVFGVSWNTLTAVRFALQVDTEYLINVHPAATLATLEKLHDASRIERGRNTTAFELRPQRAIRSRLGQSFPALRP